MELPTSPLPGVYTSREAVRAGIDDRAMRRAVTRGELVRLRRGVFVDGTVWAAADDDERARLRVGGFCAFRGFRDVVSHDSAALLHGLPQVGAPSASVHVTDPAVRSTRAFGSLVVHAAALAETETVEIGPMRVTSMLRTLVDLLQTWPFRDGVAALDAALHRKIVTRENVLQALLRSERVFGSTTAGRAIDFADAGAASVAESLSRS